MKLQTPFFGLFFIVLAQVMVGLNIVMSKLLLDSIPVLLLLECRFLVAFVTLLPLHWLSPARKLSLKYHLSHLERQDWLFILGQAVTAGVLFNCFMLTGLTYTDANVAGIITSALPAIIAVLSWLILKEKFSMQILVCILFATSGLVVIAFDKFTGLGKSHSIIGDIIILLSLLPEAMYYVLCKLRSNRLPLFLISALMNGINAIILLPVLIFTHWEFLPLSLNTSLILVAIGLTSGLFYIFWFMGSHLVDGMLASLSTSVMPVATVILAYVVLSEIISPMQLLGMGLVILSIIIYAKKQSN